MKKNLNSHEISLQQRRVTIKDVATRAGVTQPAVSVVLNGARSNTLVSASTREKILQAANELGYRPNLSAQTMKSGKSHIIGVLVRNNARAHYLEALSHPFTYEMVLGINEGLEQAGYMMCLVRLSDVDPEMHMQGRVFQGHLLDGLIIVSDVPAITPERLKYLFPRCIWLDSTVWHEHNCVQRDEIAAGQDAAKALADAGYRDWIYLTRPLPPAGVAPHYSSDERLSGIQAIARAVKANLSIYSVAHEEDIDISILQKVTRQTGVILGDGYFIPQFARAAMRARLCPGEDFALVSCEQDFTSAGHHWQNLAQTKFDRFGLGLHASQMMLTVLDSSQSIVPSERIHMPFLPGTTIPPCPLKL